MNSPIHFEGNMFKFQCIDKLRSQVFGLTQENLINSDFVNSEDIIWQFADLT